MRMSRRNDAQNAASASMHISVFNSQFGQRRIFYLCIRRRIEKVITVSRRRINNMRCYSAYSCLPENRHQFRRRQYSH